MRQFLRAYYFNRGKFELHRQIRKVSKEAAISNFNMFANFRFCKTKCRQRRRGRQIAKSREGEYGTCNTHSVFAGVS